MAGYLEEKELEALKSDIESSKNAVTASQIALANKLKNGLGTTMKEELKNPPKPQKIKGTRYRIKRFFNSIKEKIKIMFIYNG